LGVVVIHLIERKKLVSGETCVTICIAVSKSRDRGKNDTVTERESKRMIDGGQGSKARRILSKDTG
jgi:hypothetical protein